jgi:hypothetical protein
MTPFSLARRWTSAVVAAIALSTSVHAINFDLVSAEATLNDGNPGDSMFVHVDDAGVLTGDMAGLYSATMGGDELAGFWVRIDFGGEPQPFLTSATLKAANQYLLWDAADLAAFNAGTFTSITLWNSGPGGIMNQNERFQEISHADLYGEPGTNVPDGGLTVALLGFGLAAAAGARRLVRR